MARDRDAGHRARGDQKEMPPDQWRSAVLEARRHDLYPVLLEEPYARDARTKPRGYAGDAHTLDFVYRHRPLESTVTPLATQAFDGGGAIRVDDSRDTHAIASRRMGAHSLAHTRARSGVMVARGGPFGVAVVAGVPAPQATLAVRPTSARTNIPYLISAFPFATGGAERDWLSVSTNARGKHRGHSYQITNSLF